MEIKEVSYTAYRFKVSWVNKIISVARTIWKPVKTRPESENLVRTHMVRQAHQENQGLAGTGDHMGEKNGVGPGNTTCPGGFMEPHTAYTHKAVPIWIPPRKIQVPFINYYEKKTPIREKVMIEVPIEGNIELRWVLVDGKDIPFWVL